MNRRQQLQLWLLALDRFELRLRGKIARARNAFLRSASEAYENNHGQVPGWVQERHRQGLGNILAAHYQVVIPHFGAMALRQVKSRRIERKAAESIFASFMREWVSTEALRKATMIAATDQDDVRDAIQTGIDEGEGTAAIGRRIRDVAALTTVLAAAIARTETHNAAAFGSMESARRAEDDLGVQLVKAWLPTLDDRTRPAHRAMRDAAPVALGEKFNVGGEIMDRPGDPSASPDNVINCRCALAYEEA